MAKCSNNRDYFWNRILLDSLLLSLLQHGCMKLGLFLCPVFSLFREDNRISNTFLETNSCSLFNSFLCVTFDTNSNSYLSDVCTCDIYYCLNILKQYVYRLQCAALNT